MPTQREVYEPMLRGEIAKAYDGDDEAFEFLYKIFMSHIDDIHNRGTLQ